MSERSSLVQLIPLSPDGAEAGSFGPYEVTEAQSIIGGSAAPEKWIMKPISQSHAVSLAAQVAFIERAWYEAGAASMTYQELYTGLALALGEAHTNLEGRLAAMHYAAGCDRTFFREVYQVALDMDQAA